MSNIRGEYYMENKECSTSDMFLLERFQHRTLSYRKMLVADKIRLAIVPMFDVESVDLQNVYSYLQDAEITDPDFNEKLEPMVRRMEYQFNKVKTLLEELDTYLDRMGNWRHIR